MRNANPFVQALAVVETVCVIYACKKGMGMHRDELDVATFEQYSEVSQNILSLHLSLLDLILHRADASTLVLLLGTNSSYSSSRIC